MRTRFNHVTIGTIFGVSLLLLAARLQAQEQAPYLPDRILVKPGRPGELNEFHQELGTAVIKSFPLIGGLQVVRLPAGLSVEEAIQRFEASGLVRYATPDRTEILENED